jgi:putative ABC transport system ATP-binding protein
LLFEQAAKAGSAVLMVSHDERLGDRFHRVVRLEDIVTTRGAAA